MTLDKHAAEIINIFVDEPDQHIFAEVITVLRAVEAKAIERAAKVAEAHEATFRTGARINFEQGDIDEAEVSLMKERACRDVARAIRALQDEQDTP